MIDMIDMIDIIDDNTNFSVFQDIIDAVGDTIYYRLSINIYIALDESSYNLCFSLTGQFPVYVLNITLIIGQ
jgi:hypothetical protein